MSDLGQVRMIALRIREMRELDGLTLQEVANAVGVTSEEYMAYESGEVDIPIGFLTGVAPVLGVEVTELLTGSKPKLSVYCLVRSGKGVSAQRRTEYRYQSLAYNFAHKVVEPFLVTVDPDDPAAPIALNSHEGQEFDYVVEGTLIIAIAGKELEMRKGDSIYFDSSTPHGMKAAGTEPVKFIALVIPPPK